MKVHEISHWISSSGLEYLPVRNTPFHPPGASYHLFQHPCLSDALTDQAMDARRHEGTTVKPSKLAKKTFCCVVKSTLYCNSNGSASDH